MIYIDNFSLQASLWTEILFDGFENGNLKKSQFFYYGNADALTSTYQYFGGKKSLMIRSKGRRSKATTGLYYVSNYSSLRIHFYYLALGMESKEKFGLQYYSDKGGVLKWRWLKRWSRGAVDFPKNGLPWNEAEITINASDMTKFKVRFVSLSSDRTDRVFIDDFRLSAI